MNIYLSFSRVKLILLLTTVTLFTFACSEKPAADNMPNPEVKNSPTPVAKPTSGQLTTVHTGRYIEPECTDGHKGGKYMEAKGYEITAEDGQYFVFNYAFYCNEDEQNNYHPAGLESAQMGGYPEKTPIVRLENQFIIGENNYSQMEYSTDGKNLVGYVSSQAKSKYIKLVDVVEDKKGTLSEEELIKFNHIKQLISPGGKVIMVRISEEDKQLNALFLQGQELYQASLLNKN